MKSIVFLRDVLTLALPFWRSEERWWARRMLALLVLVKAVTIWLVIQQNHWYKTFYMAIEARDVSAFWAQIGFFAAIAVTWVGSLVWQSYIGTALQARWRDWLVRDYMRQWLEGRTYYRMQIQNRETSNPDQRIAEDLGQFANHTLHLTIGVLDVGTSLIAFTAILWGLSGTIEVAGVGVPGYMVFAVYAFTGLSSYITHLIGRPLSNLYNEHSSLEADFRFGLVRVRENAESIAFYKGEEREQANLEKQWQAVQGNVLRTLRLDRRLGWFTHSYGQFTIIVPFLLAAPRFFAGEINFGEVMQVTAAFGATVACLNFFINSYSQIAHWRAETNRIKAFRADLETTKREHVGNFEVGRMGKGLVITDLRLDLPNARKLLDGFNLKLDGGEAVLLKGPSGTGKSTMLRAFAGIWPYGGGQIHMGSGETFFVPQRPYLPLGSLKEAACYPGALRSDEDVVDALVKVNLAHLTTRLHDIEPWSQRLSGGEQQRLGFARVLLAKPSTVFLDEATSALDEENEKLMYSLLRNAPWKPTIVSVGHRSSLDQFHERSLLLA